MKTLEQLIADAVTNPYGFNRQQLVERVQADAVESGQPVTAYRVRRVLTTMILVGDIIATKKHAYSGFSFKLGEVSK